MTYYSNCSAGSSNYSVSTPNVRYSLGSNSASYSMAVDAPQSMYQGTGNYSLPAVIPDAPVSNYNSERVIVPKKAELLTSKDFERGFDKPIDRIIDDFFPKKHINPAIDEIERALANVVRIEQFEVQEEIIIRRKVVRKSAVFDKGKGNLNGFN